MTGYLYDGDCVVAEFDAQGKVRAQYIHGQGLGADVGSLICAQMSGAGGATSERYYSHNWRGDVIGITDESGASLARYRYGAFGELIAGDGGIANNILFSGKRYDSDIGLYYFGARYYDPSAGRFISSDPLGFVDGPNEYIFVKNNPLSSIDPWGLEKWLIIVPGTNVKNGNDDVNVPEWSKGNKFTQELSKTFGVKETNVLTFMWSGANNSEARTDAAKNLSSLVNQIRQQDSNANIANYSHSHAGNLSMESTSYGAKFETLVTAGTPVRDDYLNKYVRENVGTHIQLYDTSDMVQVSGGYNLTGHSGFEMGTASRKIPGIINLQVETGNGFVESHKNFNDFVIYEKEIAPLINNNLQNSSKSSNRGFCK